MKILLVENKVSDQKFLIQTLIGHNVSHLIEVASNTGDAITLLKDKSYDLVIMDYILDGGMGLDLMDHCKQTPVIIVSGRGTEDTIIEAMKRGAYDYIVKDRDLGYLKLIGSTLDSVLARREAETKAQHYLKDLERSNRELEEYAQVVAHELQEPLRKVQYFHEKLESLGEQISENEAHYFNRAQKATARMQQYIRDLLEYARIGQKDTPMVNMDLNRSLEDVMASLREGLESRQATFERQALPKFKGQPYLMRQLFHNILHNSIKFAKEDTPLQLKLLYSPLDPDGFEIRIQDNASGFDDQYARRAFHPFERLGNHFNRESSGMGLAICKKIMDLHQGQISAESSPGDGTTIILSFPNSC